MIYYEACPACDSKRISPVCKAIDHTVSKEVYEICECFDCTLRFTQNIPDISNIGKYYASDAYVSHSDTKQGLVNTMYHWVRKFTLHQKQKLITRITGLKRGKILDIGAGTGAFTHVMQQSGWEVKGLEPDATARAQALKNYGIALDLPGELYSLNNDAVDAITMWHVLEHVHDLKGYWEVFTKILGKEGRLIIAVPNYTSYDARYYGAYWAAYDVPRHLYHFSPRSIEKLAKQFGFEIECLKPMWFDAVYVSLLSEQYKKGKPNVTAGVWHGLRSNASALLNRKACSSLIYVFKKSS